MSLYYVIDGYNVIETFKELFPGSSRSSREKLVDLILLRRPEGSRRNRITIIFDGQPGITSPKEKRLDVRFTSGHEADWYIKRMVLKSDNPKEIVVVTDDRSIVREVVSAGAKVLPTSNFIKKIFPVKKNKSEYAVDKIRLTDEEIEDIKRDFLKSKGLK